VTERLLEVKDLRVQFRARGRHDGSGRRRYVRAVDGVSFAVDRGEVLALVGESGSGKTTAVQAALRLVRQSSGAISFKGQDLQQLSGRKLRRVRREMQLVFQDPYESLDPRLPVHDVVDEPLRIHGIGRTKQERRQRALAALERVGLTPAASYLDRLPHELSGGQRQRLSIASALATEPDLLVADEPVSMLDVSLRAGILDLLDDLCKQGMGIVMITHDLSTAAHYADRIAVMYLGRIVEIGPARQMVNEPQHPYTRALLDGVPRADRHGAKRTVLFGEVPDASSIPGGCRFHPRCPVAVPECADIDPTLRQVPAGPTHEVACILR